MHAKLCRQHGQDNDYGCGEAMDHFGRKDSGVIDRLNHRNSILDADWLNGVRSVSTSFVTAATTASVPVSSDVVSVCLVRTVF